MDASLGPDEDVGDDEPDRSKADGKEGKTEKDEKKDGASKETGR
jgi:hypothetical protein